MDPVKPQTAAAPREPTARPTPVPMWLILLLALLIYWGMVYFDQAGGWFQPEVYAPYKSITQLADDQPPPPSGPVPRKDKYEAVCALCHGPDGMGKPGTAPPFAGSEWVLGSPNRLIPIPLLGLHDPIKVKGQVFNAQPTMPSQGSVLNDEELAGILTYMRMSWGNKAPGIVPEQVAALRTEFGNRQTTTSEEELLKRPEK